MEPKLLRITEYQEFKENGLPFRSVGAARWAYRYRDRLGLTDAFTKMGNCVLINVPKFHEILDAQENA